MASVGTEAARLHSIVRETVREHTLQRIPSNMCCAQIRTYTPTNVRSPQNSSDYLSSKLQTATGPLTAEQARALLSRHQAQCSDSADEPMYISIPSSSSSGTATGSAHLQRMIDTVLNTSAASKSQGYSPVIPPTCAPLGPPPTNYIPPCRPLTQVPL